MRIAAAILTCALTLGCQNEYSMGGEGAQTAAPAATSGTSSPLAPLQSGAAAVRSNPMVAYTLDVVAKYDPKTACLAACAAALRCRSDALFGGGSPQVAARVGTCRKGCAGEYVRRPGYLEAARACLSSGTCDAFSACATRVLPSK
jgi:hypothetical protein